MKGIIVIQFDWEEKNMSMSRAMRLVKPLEEKGLKIIYANPNHTN